MVGGMDDLRDIPVGPDRFRAVTIEQACRAAGFKVELLFADDSGYGALQSHRLLVKAKDYPQIMEIVRHSDNVR